MNTPGAFLCMVCLLAACNVEVNSVSNRSGTITDDYVEEPLSDMSRKYEGALQQSNAMVDKFRASAHREVYETLCGPKIRSQMSEAQFTETIRTFETRLGPIKSYKPMQWGFTTHKASGKWLVQSTKIVEHERGMANYTFVFDEAGPYTMMLGFQINPRKGSAQPASDR